MLDQVEQRRLGPVQVVDDGDERPVGGQDLEQPPHAPEHLLDGVHRPHEPDRRRDAVGHLGVAAGERGELAARALGRVVLADVRRGAHGLGNRPERDPVAVGQAAAAHDHRRAAEAVGELAQQARLADAGLADDGHDAAAAGRLTAAASSRRSSARSSSRPTSGEALACCRGGQADQAEGRHALGLALQLERLDRLGRRRRRARARA